MIRYKPKSGGYDQKPPYQKKPYLGKKPFNPGHGQTPYKKKSFQNKGYQKKVFSKKFLSKKGEVGDKEKLQIVKNLVEEYDTDEFLKKLDADKYLSTRKVSNFVIDKSKEYYNNPEQLEIDRQNSLEFVNNVNDQLNELVLKTNDSEIKKIRDNGSTKIERMVKKVEHYGNLLSKLDYAASNFQNIIRKIGLIIAQVFALVSLILIAAGVIFAVYAIIKTKYKGEQQLADNINDIVEKNKDEFMKSMIKPLFYGIGGVVGLLITGAAMNYGQGQGKKNKNKNNNNQGNQQGNRQNNNKGNKNNYRGKRRY